MQGPGRTATVVVVHRGEVVGALPPVALDMPWWPEVHDLVAAVRERDDLEITVLRLLRATSDRIAGGEVSYLAETDRPPHTPLSGWPGDPLTDQPLRQTWARPGGPAELLDWADDRLDGRGLRRTGPAQQMRTWNLSAMWRIPTSAGPVWLKAVPDFFAHEGAVIDWIGAPVAPRLIDFAPGRTLLAEIEGEANHGVREEHALRPMVRLLTGLQQLALGRVDELTAIDIPHRSLPTMIPRIAAVVEQWGAALDRDERRSLDPLMAGLPARVTAIGECGEPDPLVHGDFHSGNVAGRPSGYAILDWGDSFLGHPLLDELAFIERAATLGPVRRSRVVRLRLESHRPRRGPRPCGRPAGADGLVAGRRHVRELLRQHRTRRTDLPRVRRSPHAPPGGGLLSRMSRVNPARRRSSRR